MVEFVIGVPVMLLLLYGIVELGNAMVRFSQLADAARDADRYLASKALQGTTGIVALTGPVVTATANLAVFGNTAGAGNPLLPGLSTAQVSLASDGSNNVSVAIAYPYQSIFGGTIPDFFDSGSVNTGALTLRVYTTMRAL
jgi:Flp pilus assembly protein TadG